MESKDGTPTKRPAFDTHSPLKVPTIDEVKATAQKLGFVLQPHDEQIWLEIVRGQVGAHQAVDALPEYVPRVKYPRTPGYFPSAEENPFNAWYVKTDIQGAPNGKLAGKRVAIKDNVSVAGVPMMNGSAILEGYVPKFDATVVTRTLDAGGRIIGKSSCEDLCVSGGSHTNAKGAIKNPRNPNRSAGGSSSGSAAAIANGEVEIAIGGDQGGSCRIPASYCGVVGMKPTFGLVPYSGIFGILHTIDHTGPLSDNIENNALFLEALAGPDDLDARQGPPGRQFPTNLDDVVLGAPLPASPDNDYTSDLKKGVKGMKIGLLTEGLAGSEPDVISAVRKAADLFKSLGARVDEVSVPMHALAPAIWSAAVLHRGIIHQCFGNGHGLGYSGLFDTALMNRFQNGVNSPQANTLSDSGKAMFLTAQYATDHYGPAIAGKGGNKVRQLRHEYNKALATHDVLILVTLPQTASPLPAANASPDELVTRSFEMIAHTCPFNITGHPALSMPCGNDRNDLPIGLQIVGRHLGESTIYRAAYALEKTLRKNTER